MRLAHHVSARGDKRWWTEGWPASRAMLRLRFEVDPHEAPAHRRSLPGHHVVENTPWLNTLQRGALSIMNIREVLADNLRRYRQERGLSQEELAHRAEIDRTYISALERCVYAASIDVVDRLATALGVEAADLLRKAEQPGQSDQ